MSGSPQRPGSADTMFLVLKPRQEDYKYVAAQLSCSENERLAYRKNRVIQMKLSTFLAEVCLQEKSAAVILKNEEHRFLQNMSRRTSVPRFLQNMSRRTSVPRSVIMLKELQQFMHKKFPQSAVDIERNRATGGRTVNPIPEPFRDLDSSSSVAAVSPTKPSTLFEILDRLPSAVGQRERHVVVANMSSVSNTNKMDNSMLKLEQPNITSHSKTNLNSNESSQELITVKPITNSEEACIEGNETSYPSLPNITEDINKLTEAVDIPYQAFNKPENNYVKEVFGIPFSDTSENITASLGKCLLETEENIRLDKLNNEKVIFLSDAAADHANVLKEPRVKQGLKRPSKKSTFNYSKTDRAPPLRHNITSVLRQEKTKMESHQVRMDDSPNKLHKDINKGSQKFIGARLRKQN